MWFWLRGRVEERERDFVSAILTVYSWQSRLSSEHGVLHGVAGKDGRAPHSWEGCRCLARSVGKMAEECCPMRPGFYRRCKIQRSSFGGDVAQSPSEFPSRFHLNQMHIWLLGELYHLKLYSIHDSYEINFFNGMFNSSSHLAETLQLSSCYIIFSISCTITLLSSLPTDVISAYLRTQIVKQ